MIIVKYKTALQQYLKKLPSSFNKVGFVPTMGALHEGHISLIHLAKKEHDVVVCSIFVNPTQFNNSNDLAKYPVTIEADIEKLTQAGCDFLFLPAVDEMYPPNETNKHYELGYIETILEGFYRPGHFQGVCIIVDKLLALVQPHTLFLGRKDYQQCMIIQKMMTTAHPNIHLTIGDTIREKDGLAMSSRNMRLNATERLQALKIIEALQYIQQQIKPGNVTILKKQATLFLENNGYKVDYIEIAAASTLQPVLEWDGKVPLVALVAAYLNEVRLIDNIILKSVG